MSSSHVCIYSKQPFDDSGMKSGDHVFLSAIGGQRKLPQSYVSHEVNNSFSKLEKRFSRDSLISMIRQFEGPGKRGSLNKKKASKSNVCVMTSESNTGDNKEKYQLGYIKSSKPYILNQFIFSLDTNAVSITLDPYSIQEDETHQEKINSFVESAKNYSGYILITDEKLPDNLALFGELDRKWFLSIKHEDSIPIVEKMIKAIIKSKSVNIKTSKESSSQVKAHQKYQFDIEETYRMVAKMAFNFLALDRGAEYMLDSSFDPIRNWIYTGEGDMQFVAMTPTKETPIEELIPNFPKRAHCILITQIGNQIIATVNFYEKSFSFIVFLATLNSAEIHYPFPLGLICDWNNRSEYTLLEHLKNDTVTRTI